MSFYKEQRVFIVEHYFASRFYARVADEFRREYPDSAVPNNSTITGIINRFRQCGSVSDRKISGRPAFLTEAKLADVEKMLQRSPSKRL
jgi:transposase